MASALDFRPPSLDRISEMSEDDFLLDPEQFRDILPQPYRMIDRVLNSLLEGVWEIIEEKEALYLAYREEHSLPMFESLVQLQEYEGVNCLCSSVDGKYIFIGLTWGLGVIESWTHQLKAFWEEEKHDIVKLDAYIIADEKHLLCSIDNMGTGRLFAFVNDILVILIVLNQKEEQKPLIVCCESSHHDSFLGVVFENCSTQETWLEIYRLPKEKWLEQLDTATAQVSTNISKEGVEIKMSPFTSATNIDETNADMVDKSEEHQHNELIREETQNRCGVRNNIKNKIHCKFSAPILMFRIHPLPSLTENPAASLYQACKNVGMGEIILTGANHILTQEHLDLRTTVFNHFHMNLLDFLQENHERVQKFPTFHFVKAGQLALQELYHSVPDESVDVLVWWSEENLLSQYSLQKNIKDAQSNPEFVWPFSSSITSSFVSDCSRMMVVGLENGNIIIWDRYFGTHRGVLTSPSMGRIEQLEFLPVEDGHEPNCSHSARILARSNGVVQLITSPFNKPVTAMQILQLAKNSNSLVTFLKPLTKSELVLVFFSNGIVKIFDVLKNVGLCELTLPETHHLASPWKPELSLGERNQHFYLKGFQNERNEENHLVNIATLFVYHLETLYPLSDYFAEDEQKAEMSTVIQGSIDNQICILLKERKMQQELRQMRQKKRWGKLTEELCQINSQKITSGLLD